MTNAFHFKEGSDWEGRRTFEIVRASDGKHMASIRYWLDEVGTEELAEMKSDAEMIVDALNAHKPEAKVAAK